MKVCTWTYADSTQVCPITQNGRWSRYFTPLFTMLTHGLQTVSMYTLEIMHNELDWLEAISRSVPYRTSTKGYTG